MINDLDQSYIVPIAALTIVLALVVVYLLKRRFSREHVEFDAGLLSRFRTAVPDINVRERLMNAERRKHPHKPESELITNVLESYYRDRW